MSILQITKAYQCDLPPNLAFVLVTLADWADDNGNNIFPELARVAWKTGYKYRQCSRIVQELKKAQILVARGRHGRAINYSLDLSKAPQKTPYTPPEKKPRCSRSKLPSKSPEAEPARSVKMTDLIGKNDRSDRSSPAQKITLNRQLTVIDPSDPKSLNRDFAKSLQNLPPIHVVPKRPAPPLLKVDPPAPSKAKAQPAKKTSAHKKAAAKVQAAPKVRAPRKPQPTDPLWNAIADSFFNGARRDNQQLARILFGQQNHGIFGLIANEAERQNLQPQELDYDHLARLVPKFQASLPKDKITGKPIELRDPATWLTRWEGWRNDYTDCIGTSMLTYDPNCPNHCDHGDLYTFDEKGRSTFRGYCQCRLQILEARKKGRTHA